MSVASAFRAVSVKKCGKKTGGRVTRRAKWPVFVSMMLSPSLGGPTNGRFAREVKFGVPHDRLAEVVRWAREHMQADVNGSGAGGDSYRITTVYFDTPELDVYYGRGSFARTKYRLRRYGSSPVVFAERKLKVGERVSKRRTPVPLEEIGGAPADDADWTWFDERVRLRGLRPVCRLSYSRVARVGEADGSTIRLTIDQDIQAKRTHRVSFGEGQGVPLVRDQLIVELKYRHEMPSIFRRFVDVFELQPRACSKYKLAVPALGIASTAASLILCVA